MSNEIHQYFSELLAALRIAEAEQKKIYDNAIDIEDMAEATAVTIDARTKIQLLRKNIEELQRIHDEFSSTFVNEYKVLSGTNESEVISDTGSNLQTGVFPTESETQQFIETAETEESTISPLDENEPYDESAKLEIKPILLNEPEINQMTLDESVVPSENDEHITAHPREFILLGNTCSVSGWQEILSKLCEAMVLRKPYKFASISVTPTLGESEQRVLSLDEQKITEPYAKLSNGLYVTTAGSPKEIKTRCEHILKACGYNSDVLQIS